MASRWEKDRTTNRQYSRNHNYNSIISVASGTWSFGNWLDFCRRSAKNLKNYLSKKENNMERITLTVGFIPEDWEGNSDGKKVVLVGDTDFSKTIENEIEIGDDDFTNLTTGSILSGDMNDIYKQLRQITEVISENKYVVPSIVIKSIYETFLEECEDGDSFIMHHEYDLSQFENARKKYNRCFYFRYIVEEDDNIETEILIISRSNTI